jgi:hypothetical protein
LRQKTALVLSGTLLCAMPVAPVPAAAQMMLPGASAPTQAGVVQKPASSAKPKPKAAPMRVASDDSVIGKPLLLNGTRGRITIERGASGLEARVLLAGDQISRPTEACGVDLGGGAPLALTPAGRPDGVLRYELAFPGCPIQFDVLDGAVLASGVNESCRFPDNDCRADPRGMWGPSAASVEADAAAIEAARGSADKAVRASFKQLLSQVQKSKDKVAVRVLASEQAGFTSRRDTICRDYQREAAHGFCSARYTEFRAASLSSRLGVEPAIATAPAAVASRTAAATPGVDDPASSQSRVSKPRPAPPRPKVNLGTFY